MDAYSKSSEILLRSGITSEETIFKRFGVIESLVSDNGTAFTLGKFQISASRMVSNTYAYHHTIHNQMDKLSDF